MNPRYIEELSWRFAEVYEATVDQILINLARHFKYYTETGVVPSGAWAYQVQKLAEMGQINRETEAIILHMMGDADESLRAVLEASILDGLKDAEPALRKAAEKGLLPNAKNIPPVLNPSQTQAFQAYYAQSADKLNLVNTVMLQSTQAAYAATVADIATKMANTQGILNTAAGEVITGVTAWNKATKDAVKKMVDNGITGFIDHGGHHWTPEAYVAMDIRTTMANTARTAVLERNEEYGNDLYQVSYHNGARPLCYPWQGKVISMSGTAGTTIDGEGNEVQVHTEDEIESFRYGGGLFGVNCGHYPIPFVPEFSRIREPQQNFEDNLKEYEESQQQRRLERNLRDEKRDLEVMKAQGASEEEIKAQRAKVRKASKDIDEFCAETGRARRRSRETTPIKAEFPDVPKPDTPAAIKQAQTETEALRSRVQDMMRGRDEIWNGAPEEYKEAIISSLNNADADALKRIENTLPNYHATWYDGDGTSCYWHGTGSVDLYTRSGGDPRRAEDVVGTWWHEYGHFYDDTHASKSGVMKHFVLGTYETDIYGVTNIATFDDELYGRAAVKDINAFLQRSHLDDRFEMQMDRWGSSWLHYKGGDAVDFTTISYEDQNALCRALHDWSDEYSGLKRAHRYAYEQGYPVEVNWDDYFESYVTPKRGLYRTREKFKGAEEAYHAALMARNEAIEAFEATHDTSAMWAEQRRLTEIAEAIQRRLGFVTDTFDESSFGAFMSPVIGGHTQKYYLSHDHGVEGTANVFMAITTGDEIVNGAFKDLCPNIYGVLLRIIQTGGAL